MCSVVFISSSREILEVGLYLEGYFSFMEIVGWVLFLLAYFMATPGFEPKPLFTQILAVAISLELLCVFQSFQSNIRVNFVVLTY